MNFKHFTKPLPFLALLAALYPVLMIFALLLSVVMARLYLGFWPSYGNPDPKQICLGVPALMIQLCLMFVPVAVISAIALAIFGRKRTEEFPFGTIIITTAVSFVLLILYCRIDPGGFVDWFMD